MAEAPLALVMCALTLALAFVRPPRNSRREDEATCAGFGFHPGTDAFATCLQRESLARRYLTPPPAPYWGWGTGAGAGDRIGRDAGAVIRPPLSPECPPPSTPRLPPAPPPDRRLAAPAPWTSSSGPEGFQFALRISLRRCETRQAFWRSLGRDYLAPGSGPTDGCRMRSFAVSVPCSTNIQTREQLMLCVSNC